MNRENITIKKLLLIGFGCGLTSSLCAQAAMHNSDNFVQIAVVTGFIYITLLCTFFGWRKERIVAGAFIGTLVGAAYAGLAQGSHAAIGERFFGEMVNNFIVFPCALSGVLATALASYQGSHLKEVPMRFFKGAFAGLVLGCAHFGFVISLMSNTYLLGSSGTFLLPVAVALGLASAIYYPLISWAIGFRTQPGPISKWLSKLSMWRAGLILFGLMTLLGALWSFYR